MLMRTANSFFLCMLAIFLGSANSFGGIFGTVVPVGGHASDIALDERRGVLYIANFAANRVDVLSLTSRTLGTPYSVPPQPANLALSPDLRYLLVGSFYEPRTAVVNPPLPSVTIIDLDAGVRRNIALGASPLSIAFGIGAKALVVTTKGFQLLDPASGTLENLPVTFAPDVAKLPVEYPEFPPNITKAATGVSGNGQVVYILVQGAGAGGEGGAGSVHLLVKYNSVSQFLEVQGYVTSPPWGPRSVSVDLEGRNLVAGWSLLNSDSVLLAQYPYATGQYNLGGHFWDIARNVIYGQIPVAASGSPGSGEGPVLTLFDTDNLTVRERVRLKENIAGRMLMTSDLQTIYAVSDSGVMILPIGSFDQLPRLIAVQEAVVFRGNSCDRRIITGYVDLFHPAGGSPTDFRLVGAPAGVRITPSSGTTPAKVKIEVDPAAFQNRRGTTTVTLQIQSAGAINIPMPVNLQINTREPEQRGAFYNVPGKLVDLVADPVRNRFYVLRQDKNLMLVFDGTTFEQLAALRTGNTPTQMAMTADKRLMLVANDNSQIANIFNLDTLQPEGFIEFPGGHYPRSIAVSNRAILSSVRSAAGPVPPCGAQHVIDKIDLFSKIATTLPSLGPYCNGVSVDSVLAASPSAEFILLAMPDGNTLLYDGSVDTFTAARKDLPQTNGAIAAVTDQLYLVDNALLNWSLVPISRLETNTGRSSGFSYVDGFGLRTTGNPTGGPGVIQRVDLYTLESIRPTLMVEAPVLYSTLSATPPIGQIGQTILPFTRTLAPLSNRTSIVSLSVSGFVVLPWDFDAAVAKPVITSVVNSVDGGGLAPGTLVTIRGANLSSMSAVTNEVPLPTTLAEACFTVNNFLVPLFSVSPAEVRGQLPYDVAGAANIIARSAGGTSDPFPITILSGAPAIFRNGTAGPETGLAAVYRTKNNQLATLANPIHPEETIVIYVTGLGRTSPQVPNGTSAPDSPLHLASESVRVTLGEVPLAVEFAGLVPGFISVYQINAFVPDQVPIGFGVPLTVSQQSYSTTISMRVVR